MGKDEEGETIKGQEEKNQMNTAEKKSEGRKLVKDGFLKNADENKYNGGEEGIRSRGYERRMRG